MQILWRSTTQCSSAARTASARRSRRWSAGLRGRGGQSRVRRLSRAAANRRRGELLTSAVATATTTRHQRRITLPRSIGEALGGSRTVRENRARVGTARERVQLTALVLARAATAHRSRLAQHLTALLRALPRRLRGLHGIPESHARLLEGHYVLDPRAHLSTATTIHIVAHFIL
jgi:hypothetical protein